MYLQINELQYSVFIRTLLNLQLMINKMTMNKFHTYFAINVLYVIADTKIGFSSRQQILLARLIVTFEFFVKFNLFQYIHLQFCRTRL